MEWKKSWDARFAAFVIATSDETLASVNASDSDWPSRGILDLATRASAIDPVAPLFPRQKKTQSIPRLFERSKHSVSRNYTRSTRAFHQDARYSPFRFRFTISSLIVRGIVHDCINRICKTNLQRDYEICFPCSNAISELESIRRSMIHRVCYDSICESHSLYEKRDRRPFLVGTRATRFI